MKEHDYGMMVNVYYVAKMFDSSIEATLNMLKETYETERDDRKTFAEWVNEKRKFVASVVGQYQYF